jgi:thiamine biosynthesis protein ThiS
MMERVESREGVFPVVNGEARAIPVGSTLGDLLRALSVSPDVVVVEYNREIIRGRAELDARVLSTGDAVEIVHFVGGG